MASLLTRANASILAIFALTVLATVINVACSNVDDVDDAVSGLNGYGNSAYGPASRDVAADESR